MVILGIDPGTATTGWGVIEKVDSQTFRLVNFGCVITPANTALANRIEQIYDELTKLIHKEKPEVMGVENLFFNTNAKTAMLVGQARGAVLLAGRKTKLRIEEYTPLQVKIAVTGYGRAEKSQVQQMVKVLLKLKAVPKPDDAADALAVAITCGLSLR